MTKQHFQVLDILPLKGIDIGLSNAILRKYSESAIKNGLTYGLDLTRTKLNFEIGRGGIILPVNDEYSLIDRFKDNLYKRNIKDPNENLPTDSRKRRKNIAAFILQGSKEKMRELAFENQKIAEDSDCLPFDNSHIVRNHKIEEWAKDMYKFMCTKFGEDNIIAFIVNLDISNPCAHCLIVTTGFIKGKTRISWKRMMGGENIYEAKEKFLKLHDELAEVNRKWGLIRGKPKTETKTTHKSFKSFLKQVNEIKNH